LAATSKRRPAAAATETFAHSAALKEITVSNNHHETAPAAGPCVMVIFGATGDLTKRKLIPALLNLAQEEILSKQFAIIGVAVNDFDTESFRKTLSEEMPRFAPDPIDLKMWEWLSQRIYYVKGDFADKDLYQRLKAQIEEVEKVHATYGNKFFYLAVAPRFFAPIVDQLGAAGLTS
jgi:glucose-6-phosphate 1-dehydrogenase